VRRDDGSDIDIAFHEAHLTLRDGTPVLIRQLVAEDAALYPDFLSDVTAEDLRLRFFGPMREVSHELLDKLIHYDPACATAFIADQGPPECPRSGREAGAGFRSLADAWADTTTPHGRLTLTVLGGLAND
jgi:hypothetical protein